MTSRLWTNNVVPLLLGSLASAVAALAITQETRLLSALLMGMLLVSGVAVFLSLRPEHVFLPWLFVAPFLQNEALDTTFGNFLAIGLYAFPALFFALWTFTNQFATRPIWTDALPALYVLYVLASAVVGPGFSAPEVKNFYLTVVVGPLVYYFCAFAPLPRGILTRTAAVLLTSCIVLAIMTWVETFTGWNLWGDREWHEFSRTVATLANPAVLGAFLGMGIVTATACLIWRGPASLRRLSLLTLLIASPALVFTLTRGPIVGTIAAVGLIVVASARTRWVGIASLTALALAAVVSWSSFESTDVYQERLGNRGNIQERFLLQQWSLELAAQKPVTGWGAGSFDEAKQEAQFFSSAERASIAKDVATSHNTYLTILVELGALGVLLFFLPVAAAVIGAVRALRNGIGERWFLAAGLASLFVYGFTASTIDMRFFSFVPALSWMFVGLLRRVASPAE